MVVFVNNIARISYYLLAGINRLNWSRQRLEKYQNKKLRNVVKYAYNNVQFYHQLFRASNVNPSDIKTISDLSKLPVVRKKEMRKRERTNLISKEFSNAKLKRLSTGGSTGEPFSIYVCGKEDDWRKAIYLRAHISCGLRPRDRWVALDAVERAAENTRLQNIIGIFSRKVIPVNLDKMLQLEAITRLNPNVLDGACSSGALWLLAKEAEERGVHSIRPRVIFGTGDLIDRPSRNFIEKVFDAPYYDQFGTTEVDRTAWQCQERIHYHMDVDSVVMQFIDEDGQEVAPGERGEIVFTSLFSYAMPFIRYGTLDIGVPVEDECTCERTLPLMKVVEGRSNSFLTFPDGHVIAPMSFIETLKAYELSKEIDQYRVVQKRKNLVELYVKKTNDEVDEETIRNRLIANILEGLTTAEKVDLSDVRFDVRFVDEIPLTTRGKLKVVVSEVPAFT